MQVIGVVDLKGGHAVRARGGRRDAYAPVGAIGGTPIDGDPLALGRAYVDQLALHTLYAADLDAIAGGDMHAGAIAGLAAIAPLWVDAGISSPELARRVLALKAARAVVGLETMPSFDALSAICDAIGGERVVFSLDLRGGAPVTGSRLPLSPPEMLASRAVDAGAGAVIVLDLARVGAATGPDFHLLARVAAAVPAVGLFAGGGIRDAADLARLADVGCAGALVASALHDGGLSATR
jgi:phosphoribosylformimino-5-aminoimidazole carboxamide ribotide isomerase